MEIIVYTETLNITNEVALPFWACADVSLGNGANGTVLDVVTVGVGFSTLAALVLMIGTFERNVENVFTVRMAVGQLYNVN